LQNPYKCWFFIKPAFFYGHRKNEKANQKDLLNALIWTMRSHLSFFLPYSSSKRFGDLYANV